MKYSQLRRRIRRFFKAYKSIPIDSFKFYLKGLIKALDYPVEDFESLAKKIIMDLRNQTFLSQKDNYLYLRSLSGPLSFPSENNLVLKFELKYVIKAKIGIIKPFKNPDGTTGFLYLTTYPSFLIPLPSFNKEHPYYFREGAKIILRNHRLNNSFNLCYLVKNKQTFNRILESIKELDPQFKWGNFEKIWIASDV